jgi:hypothetical protein
MLINTSLRWPSNTNGPTIWFGRVSHHTLTLNGRWKLLCRIPCRFICDHRWELQVLFTPVASKQSFVTDGFSILARIKMEKPLCAVWIHA